jgi:hypothetical protein
MSGTDTWPRLEAPLEELDHRLPGAESETTHLRARLEALERVERLDDLERNGTPHAVAAPEPAPIPEDLTPTLDLTGAAAYGRRVRITTEGIRSLGIGELARVASLTGVGIAELRARSAAPGGELVVVAMAYVLALRLEPDATWDDAQRWRIEVVAPAAADPPISSRNS